jgi:hypothetical protein
MSEGVGDVGVVEMSEVGRRASERGGKNGNERASEGGISG